MTTDWNLAATISQGPVSTSGTSCSSFGGLWKNLTNANDGNDLTNTSIGAAVKSGPCTYTTSLLSDLGAAHLVTLVKVLLSSSGPHTLNVYYRNDPGDSWTSAGSLPTDASPDDFRYLDLGAGISARYWQLEWPDTRSSLSYYASKAITTWSLLGDDPAPPPPPPDPTPGVILDPTGDAIDITTDVISWRIQRGASAEITGSAQPGSAVVVLKNTDDRYNPENGSSDIIDLLRDGTGIWIGINNDGHLTGSDIRGLFGGRIADITVVPVPGAVTAPFVELTCEDALGWLSRTPVTLPFYVGVAQDELRRTILIDAAEDRRTLANEIQTIPLAAGTGPALSLLEDINQANGTRHFADPADDFTDWYSYTTRNRQWRLDGTTDASLSQLSDHVTESSGWRLSADTVTNQQKATVVPIDFSAATFTVWTADHLPLNVTTTRPYTVWVQFDDYVLDPVVDSASTGATPTITLTAFGDAAKLEITVSSGTATFTRLSIEGSIARRLPAESWIADDLTSQALPRGVRSGSDIGNEYVGVMAAARGIAEHIVWRYGNPQYRPTVKAHNWFPEMFDLDLFDVISFTSPQLGVTSRHMEIVGLTHESDIAATNAVHHTVTYVLQECRVQSDPGWFVLDTSELDSTDKLGY